MIGIGKPDCHQRQPAGGRLSSLELDDLSSSDVDGALSDDFHGATLSCFRLHCCAPDACFHEHAFARPAAGASATLPGTAISPDRSPSFSRDAFIAFFQVRCQPRPVQGDIFSMLTIFTVVVARKLWRFRGLIVAFKASGSGASSTAACGAHWQQRQITVTSVLYVFLTGTGQPGR